jgi:hypothetical protein
LQQAVKAGGGKGKQRRDKVELVPCEGTARVGKVTSGLGKVLPGLIRGVLLSSLLLFVDGLLTPLQFIGSSPLCSQAYSWQPTHVVQLYDLPHSKVGKHPELHGRLVLLPAGLRPVPLPLWGKMTVQLPKLTSWLSPQALLA